MFINDAVDFLPDWACPPGSTMCDFLDEMKWSKDDFAQKMGFSYEQIQDLINGAMQITEDLAANLTSVLGGSVGFWLSRESQYREALERVATNEQWLKSLPVRDMINYGWLSKKSNIQEKISDCLEFFDVSSVFDWFQKYEDTRKLFSFRTSTSFEAGEGATLAWLRKGEMDSHLVQCSSWNLDSFCDQLPYIRQLTREKSPEVFIPKLKELCAECGVAVVIVRPPKGCRASGATRFLSNDKALLMLSVRYLSDDQFWFTFFHEAGHLILHSPRNMFLENCGVGMESQENEADNFSFNQLIPQEYQAELRDLRIDIRTVMRFARKIGVSPGIVVGQMQHFGSCPYKALNNLKTRYNWDNFIL